MEPLYERKFCIANGNPLVIPVGRTIVCFALGFPHSARIQKLIVAQAGGPSVGYKVDLYNQAVCAYEEEPDYGLSLSVQNLGCDAAMARVIPTQPQTSNNGVPGTMAATFAAPGATVEWYDAHGNMFRNREGTFSVPVRLIYLSITLQSKQTMTTEWEAAIGCEPSL